MCIQTLITIHTLLNRPPQGVRESKTKTTVVSIIHTDTSHQTLISVPLWWWAGGLWEVRSHAGWGFNMGGWPIFKVVHIFGLGAFVIKARSTPVTEWTPWPACIWWWLISDLSTQSLYIRLSPGKLKKSKTRLPESLRLSQQWLIPWPHGCTDLQLCGMNPLRRILQAQ